MKIGAIIGVFSASLIFGALFAVGGAGIYGSPFAGKTSNEYAIYEAAILVGPIGSLLALVFSQEATLPIGCITGRRGGGRRFHRLGS